MADDLIRYDVLVQDALKGVVRKILMDTVRDGLRGEHHFYVTFRTRHPGVRLSQRLRERYPDEMTVVLQHMFWDLGVTEHAFEVGLSFDNIPERLLIPFEAITGFYDPSVQFGLKFEPMDEAEDGPDEEVEDESAPPPAKPAAKRARPASKPPRTTPAVAGPVAAAETRSDGKPEPRPPGRSKVEKAKESDATPTAEGAAVVSLDSFRKKK